MCKLLSLMVIINLQVITFLHKTHIELTINALIRLNI